MTTTTKVLLSTPSVLGFFYVPTLAFPTAFTWLHTSMDAYYFQLGTIQALTILQLVLLIKKVWSFKALERSTKTRWTWYLIFFNWMASLLFIWNRVDIFDSLSAQSKNP
jgi:hypothetical protein